MKIGLFELTSYHEECLYSQVKFLRDGGHHLELFLHPSLKKQVAPYEALANRCSYFDFTPGTFLPRRFGRFLRLYRYLAKGRFDVLIFNTASSKKELLLLCLLFRKGRPALTGTLHNLRKLQNSLTQKVFSASIRHYLVLNDSLVESGRELAPRNTFSSYYPIFFPDFPEIPLEKPPGEIWVCIPGAIETKRRDYDFVLQVLQGLPQNTPFRFILLGRPEPGDPQAQAFAETVTQSTFQGSVKLFRRFIPNAEFHAYLQAADYIWLPLHAHDAAYLKYKISGPMNLAFAYRKPLLCPQSMALLPDLQATGLFYEDCDSFRALLTQLTRVPKSEKSAYDFAKGSYDHQMRNYNALVASLAKKTNGKHP